MSIVLWRTCKSAASPHATPPCFVTPWWLKCLFISPLFDGDIQVHRRRIKLGQLYETSCLPMWPLCLPKNKITPKWINRPFFVNLRITNLLPPFVADAVLQRLQQLDAWERAGLASCPKHGGSWAYAIGGDGIHKIAESRELCQWYF